MANPVPKVNGDASRYVSARTLSDHLDLGTAFIRKLESEGVLERTPRGFHIDAARIAYIQHLRRERRGPLPQHAATAELAAARAEWLRLRTAERAKALVTTEVMDQAIDEACGFTLVAMNSIAARAFPTDMASRRKVEAAIIEARREIATRCLRRAEEHEAALATSDRGNDTV